MRGQGLSKVTMDESALPVICIVFCPRLMYCRN